MADFLHIFWVDHQQTIQIGAKPISKKETILLGAPQGSLLGPIPF